MTAVVTVYSRPGCHLCEDAVARLRQIQRELPFELHELDIESDDRLLRSYLERIPVVSVDGEEVCQHFLEESVLRERLESGR